MRAVGFKPLLAMFLCLATVRADDGSGKNAPMPLVTVGSKLFTESVILGEVLAHLAKHAGADSMHRAQLGGTPVLYKALLAGAIDVYVEYTGTISKVILKGQNVHDEARMRTILADKGIVMSLPLGFNNTYEMGMQESFAQERGITTISDLRKHPDLKFGFSNEFMERADGWKGLRAAYQLPQEQVSGLDHDLAYRGLESGDIQAIDLYSTDAEKQHYRLRYLEDDRHFFPTYNAVLLIRPDLKTRAPKVFDSLLKLEGSITEETMIAMNARSKLDQIPDTIVAADFLKDTFDIAVEFHVDTRAARLLKHTVEHLYLVLSSVTAAILLAIPLGILAAKRRFVGHILLAVVGILQTVPSLAMFVFLIPLLGIGPKPAICALFLYSLLPIVRNTYAGLHDIPRHLHESAQALGLPPAARLRLIELPMAARSILAGIKTAVVINVGTATLGGFIGAHGYGEPIFTGIRLDRTDLILEGAIPAAIMALVAQGIFELVERMLVPKGLRLASHN